MSNVVNLAAVSDAALKYRPDIDGLRAIAVLAVVLFHFELGVGGGYVGVDVFFVISGYLITKLILADLERSRFSMLAFWERRVRRLLPAMFVMVGTVLVAGYFLLLPEAYKELAESVVWQMFFLSNVYFWLTTSYFAGPAEEKPLLHTWSLSVEEQFYLLVPLLMLACWRYARDRMGVVRMFIAVIAVGSFLISVYTVAFHRSVAFYLLPSRAWELALGGLLATLPSGWPAQNAWVRSGAAAAGLAAIVMACVAFSAKTPFPGVAALLPCLGTAAVIWAGESGGGGWVARLLSLRPLVFIGLISYSLYLWHWPVRAFARYWELEPPDYGQKFLMVAASIALAVGSYYFVEQPFRRRKIFGERKRLFLGAIAAVGVLAILSGIVWLSSGLPQRLSKEIFAYGRAQADRVGFQTTIEDVEAGRLLPLGAQSDGAASVLVWGDSHAMVLTPAFDDALKSLGLKGEAAAYTATAPLLDFYRPTEFGLNEKAATYNRRVLEHIAKNKPSDVFLAGNWKGYQEMRSSPEQGDLKKQLLSTVEAVAATGVKPWVVLQVPKHRQSVPKLLLQEKMLGRDISGYLDRPSEWNGLTDDGPELIERIRELGGEVFDLRPAFYEEETGAYSFLEKDGYPLYRDDNHLTPHGSRVIATDAIKAALAKTETTGDGGRETGVRGQRSEVGDRKTEASVMSCHRLTRTRRRR
jgi:peptidoglycan/LPS O-acetylase OafA/YrhL